MRLGLALFCLLALTGLECVRAQDVSVDFDRGRDFSAFKTYSWGKGFPAKNPLIDQRIRASIEEHLAARGLRRVEEGGDLGVLYIAAVDRELQFATANWATTGDWMRQTATGISVRSQAWDVEVGTLVVCLTDGEGKNLLWRGTSKTTLGKRSRSRNIMDALAEDARKVEKPIRKSVEKMFRQYPATKSGG